jgi:hypothetical protein
MLSMAVLFQSGKISSPLSSAADVRYFPVANYIISDVESSAAIETTPIKITTKHIPSELLPVIEEEKNQAKPAEQSPKATATNQAKSSITEPEETIFAKPVSIKENDATRQIIIKEEGSGTASVKVYYLTFEDGQWILQPQWVLAAKEILTDSLSLKVDSSKIRLRKVYPAQQ